MPEGGGSRSVALRTDHQPRRALRSLVHGLLRQDRARGPRLASAPLGMLRVVSSPVPSRSALVALDAVVWGAHAVEGAAFRVYRGRAGQRVPARFADAI
jgi:hypothetical protein